MSTVVIRPSFTIFRDEPSSSAVVSDAATTPSSASATVLVIVTAKDKENLHPISGRRSSTEEGLMKKSKTSALSIKILKPTRKAVESGLAPKKRKLVVSSDKNTAAGKDKDPKKEKRPTGVPRKLKAKPLNRAHKAPELPKVEEEENVEEEAVEGDAPVKTNIQVEAETYQGIMDSICYELSVLPLADMSKAFEEGSLARDKPSSIASNKELSQDEVRGYNV
jgi:hypothetical protein